MEPGNDPRLKRLLDEWHVPDTPDRLERRVLGHPRRWWRTLMTSRVRIPLPIAIAFSVALVWLTALAVSDRMPAPERLGTPNDLRGFQPVNSVNVRIERSGDAIR
jgi:hypothetical protein